MPSKFSEKERIALVKRVLEKGESVTAVCRKAGISRVIFYRWLHQYEQKREELKKSREEKLSPKTRLEIIERVKLGEPVARVCELYGISRTIFYKWLDRYEKAPEGQKLEALWDQKPKVDRYYNQASQQYEQAVLSAVAQYPELSSHKLMWVLPHIGSRPILGNHGVQNVLRRYNLNTYEQRVAYSQAYYKPTLGTRFFGIFQNVLALVGMQTPSLRRFIVRASAIFAGVGFGGTVLYGVVQLFRLIFGQPSFVFSIGIIFGLISLGIGMFFFLYSLKYYTTIAIVLSFSRIQKTERDERVGRSFLASLFGVQEKDTIYSRVGSYRGGGGLQPEISDVKLSRKPFVSIQLATYNEKRVVDRLLTAVTSQEYENYEVILVDDSTDETIEILKKWENHPRVRIIHRPSRAGYKGGALKHAVLEMDKRTEFVIIFDADFIPYPDTITQFLKYFQSLAGGLEQKNIRGTNIAVVQGYQWHVLNKSENWVTRGVRSEYAGSYVVERSGIEIYSGLKQIAGSVYMIRADILKELGWGTSITEDFELTLRLYEQGYKVVYTPYVQAPAEAVSTIKRLIRQRMRWAEGHSFNVKKMFRRLIFSRQLTLPEKFEFFYLAPYYLQALLFMIGTFCWFVAEVVFRVRLPFWTEVWGWSLVFTNMFSLPLMNMVGLFLEESEERDYIGLFSFIALSYIVAPFQGYAALKGFLEKEEGPWFRTPKTGRITDVFVPGRFYRYIFGIFGNGAPGFSKGVSSKTSEALSFAARTPGQMNGESGEVAHELLDQTVLARDSAVSSFNSFEIIKSKKWWVARATMAILLILTTSLLYFSRDVKLVYAQNWGNPLKLSIGAGEGTFPAWGNYMANDASYGTGSIFVGRKNTMNVGTNNFSWYTNLWPSGGGNATIAPGNYFLQIAKAGNCTCNTGNGLWNFTMQLQLTSNDGTSLTGIATNNFQYDYNNADNTQVQFYIQNIVGNNIVNATPNRLAFRFAFVNGLPGCCAVFVNFLINNSGAKADLVIPADLQIPEVTKPIMMIILIVVVPTIPALIAGRLKRQKTNIFVAWKNAWDDILRKLTGIGEEDLDALPV